MREKIRGGRPISVVGTALRVKSEACGDVDYSF